MINNGDIALLLVDDEPNILTALKRVFRPLGYQVYTAGGGAEGLRIMSEQAIDLVISDMRMPQMDGATFLEQVANRWPSAVRVLLTGHADMESTVSAINKGKIYRYVSKPWEDNDIKLTVRSGLEQKFLEQERRRLEKKIFRQNEELQEFNARLEEKVEQRTKDLAKAHEALKNNYTYIVKMFAGLVEARDALPAGHSSRVGEQAKSLALRMGMGDEAAQDVYYAGMLHDIGKLGLPDSALTKPYELLSMDEKMLVMEHPVIAQRILIIQDPLQEAGLLIRHHHEHYDGTGYPDGLKGDDIPLGSRILCVVNDYDALQSGTLKNAKFTESQARQFLQENSGTCYDPAVVDAFFALIDEEEQRAGAIGWLTVSSADLADGMRLARDLVAKDGVLLLAKGHVMDIKMIKKIRTFERLLGSKLDIRVERG